MIPNTKATLNEPSLSLDQMRLSVHARLAQAETFDDQLAAMMDLICKATGAERSSLFLSDQRTGELFSRVAIGESTHEIRTLDSEGIAGYCFTTGESLSVPDAYEDERFNRRIDAITGFKTRDLLCAPLRAGDGNIIGVAEALNRRDGSFGDAELARLEIITEQAGIALRGALMLEMAKRANAQESAFVKLVSETSEIQLGPLLQKIMQAVTKMLDADRSTLFLNDEKTGELFTELGQGFGPVPIRLPNDQGIAGTVFTNKTSVNIPHAYADLRFDPGFDRQTGYFTRSILCVPVSNKDGKIIGVTQVLNKRGGAFTDEDEARLRAFTAQISIGLENAKLFDDVQQMKRYNDGILASMASGVITFDDEEKIVTCNASAERILGVEAEAVIGQSAEDVFAELGDWVPRKLRRAVETKGPELSVDAELAVGAETVSVNLTALPLTGEQGEEMGSMAIFEDISTEKRIKSTMARYVDPAVADQLLEKDAAALGGKSGIATVLFSDVRSFTLMTESLGAQATVSLLNDYFTLMVGCIEDEGGMLDKFIGDEIMAVFGVPFEREDDADRALRSGVAMLRALRAFNAERAEQDEPPLKIGIGINTGPVFSGNIGSPRRMDFTVMGDGVNLASRLEGLCKAYAVPYLISDDTLHAARSSYRSREVDRVVVKGRVAPVVVHELLDHYDDASFPNMLDALAAYRDGHGYYADRRFAEAVRYFERARELNPADRLPGVYIDRCQHFLAEPPPADWNGAWVMKTK